MRTRLLMLAVAVLVAGVLVGCARRPPVQRTQRRPIEALPRRIFADTITVQDFRRVCDALARDLILQPFIASAGRPPVVTIRSLQNKTDLELDLEIFQETVRVKLMQHARGTVLFRDDVSYRDIIEERLRQSDNEIQITLTDTQVQKSTVNRGREIEYQRGSLSGRGKHTKETGLGESEREVGLEQAGAVTSKVAAVDYFLRGLIYQVREPYAGDPKRGMSYFQYQFRVVDARSGIIVWEKLLDSKLEGEYTPIVPPPPGQGTAGTAAGQPLNPYQQNPPPTCQPPPGGAPAQPRAPQGGLCPPGWTQLPGGQQGTVP